MASHCGLTLGALLRGLLRKQGHCDSGFVLGQDEEENTVGGDSEVHYRHRILDTKT